MKRTQFCLAAQRFQRQALVMVGVDVSAYSKHCCALAVKLMRFAAFARPVAGALGIARGRVELD